MSSTSSQQLPVNTNNQHGNNDEEGISLIEIVSASYGPCRGLRLSTGEWSSDDSASIPITRDVVLYLRSLLAAAAAAAAADRTSEGEQKDEPLASSKMGTTTVPPLSVHFQTSSVAGGSSTTTTTTANNILLLGNKGRFGGMNAIFGDPCPGFTKRLSVHYVVSEKTATEVYHVSFAEHENVILRRRLLKQKALKMQAPRLQRSRSLEEIVLAQDAKKRKRSWGLKSATSEVVLPLVFPFLELQERVDCRLVSRVWKHIVRDWGVATTIDSNDQKITSRPYLRGLLLHSYSSLENLVLDGFETLQKNDLHPAIPNLRKLQRLDLSRCHNLDDSTMILLAEHVQKTLRVLYIKGLEQVSDAGVKAICRSCSKLQVLDLSHVPITDEAGMDIQHLPQLRALFMRDNYQLTNKSIDVIATTCTRLSQLTLWGCIKMKNLELRMFNGSDKLVILNLWGCYSLNDDVAVSLGNMNHLSSLIVSECHRLTDTFVENVATSVPQLNHLHMRYCKRLTDKAVNIVANSLCHLYSLDLSFCTRLTATSIFNLLELRSESLSELRLKHCTQLSIGTTQTTRHYDYHASTTTRAGSDGRLIVNAIRSQPNHCLSILDLRDCGGQSGSSTAMNHCFYYPETDQTVIGLKALGFEQRAPGLFSRPARWSIAQQQIIEKITLQGNDNLERSS